MIVPTEALTAIAVANYQISDEMFKIASLMKQERFDEKEVIEALMRAGAALERTSAVIQAVLEENPLPVKPKPS